MAEGVRRERHLSVYYFVVLMMRGNFREEENRMPRSVGVEWRWTEKRSSLREGREEGSVIISDDPDDEGMVVLTFSAREDRSQPQPWSEGQLIGEYHCSTPS